MITVPIIHDEDTVGVAQVSRKGETASEAGPDFTQADANKAQQIFQDVAPFLMKALPDRCVAVDARVRVRPAERSSRAKTW